MQASIAEHEALKHREKTPTLLYEHVAMAHEIIRRMGSGTRWRLAMSKDVSGAGSHASAPHAPPALRRANTQSTAALNRELLHAGVDAGVDNPDMAPDAGANAGANVGANAGANVGANVDSGAGADDGAAAEREDAPPSHRKARRRSLLRNATQDRAELAHELRVLDDEASAGVEGDHQQAALSDSAQYALDGDVK
jgi:hypothetical protein